MLFPILRRYLTVKLDKHAADWAIKRRERSKTKKA